MRLELAVVSALLVACSSGPAPTVGPSPSPSPTPPPDARILVNGGLFLPNAPFSVAVATKVAELPPLWASLGKAAPPPEVDFEREIVIFLGISGSSSCPERFKRLVVDGLTGHVYAEWADHPVNQPCTDDLQPQGVLVAVARSVLPPGQVRLTLREELVCADCSEHPDQVLLDLSM